MNSDLLGIAKEAALRSGEVLLGRYGNITNLDFKGRIDLIPDSDRASEEMLLEFFEKETPGTAVTTEDQESTQRRPLGSSPF